MTDEFHLKGTEDVLAKLRSVSEEVGNRGARSAATRAMRIVRDAARRVAAALDDPATASNIAKKITTRYDGRRSKREGAVIVKVGVIGGAKARPGTEDEGHWRHIEFGTSKVAARPFMRPALEQNTQAVADTFVDELVPRIDKAVARAKK